MFKLIFKFITVTMFIFFLIIGLAVWKGGEPFRILGEGTIAIGYEISKFADFVDELVKDSKAVKKTYKKIKDAVGSEKEE